MKKYAIFSSVPETLLYVLLLLVLCTGAAGDLAIFTIINKHSATLAREEQNTLKIEQNQRDNSASVKNYIRCLISITPGPTAQAQAQVCFNASQPLTK